MLVQALSGSLSGVVNPHMTSSWGSRVSVWCHKNPTWPVPWGSLLLTLKTPRFPNFHHALSIEYHRQVIHHSRTSELPVIQIRFRDMVAGLELESWVDGFQNLCPLCLSMLPRNIPEVWSLGSCFPGEAVGSEGWSTEAKCFSSVSSLRFSCEVATALVSQA